MLDFLTLIPAKYRRWVYALAGLAAVVMSVWRASDGHWDEALYLLITSAFPASLAGKNVTPEAPAQPGTDRGAI